MKANHQILSRGYKKTEVGIIPKDWDLRPLGEVATFLDGKRRPVKDADRAKMRGPIPYYGASGIVDYVNDYLFDDDLILLGEDGENILSRNCRLAFRVSGKVWVNNHAHVLKPNPDISIGFLTEYLESLNYEQYNSGTAQPKLNKQTCFRIPVAVPPTKAEQDAIAEASSDSDALIESLGQLLSKKRVLKQGAMQELLTARKRLPGFKGEWELRRLGDVVDTDPDNLGADTRPHFAFNYIALEDVDCGTLQRWSEQVFRTAPSRARRRLRKGDVLVSTVRPNLMSHLLFMADKGDWVCSTGFCVVRCRDRVTHPFYVFSHLFTGSVMRQIEALLTGSNYPAINSSDVRALQLPFPHEFEEQVAIAAVLSDMDAEIAAVEAKLAKAREIKHGMMQQLLTGRIRLV